jgi:hypothetical protein
VSTASGSKANEAANKSYIRHSISYGTSGFTASAAVCSCLSEWQSKKNKPRRYKRKPQKPTSNHGYEGLLSLMQDMLRSMANMDMTRKPSPRVKQVWVKKDETIHPMRENERT